MKKYKAFSPKEARLKISSSFKMNKIKRYNKNFQCS